MLRDSVDLTPTAMTHHGTGSGNRDRDGFSTDDVERVQTRSTRPTASDTTSERQRLVRQEEAATRHSHSRRRYLEYVRPTNSLRRSVLNSTAMHVNGNTSARSPITPVDTQSAAAHTHSDGSASARPFGNSDSHSESHSDSQSDNFVDDYRATLIHPLSSASGAQF